jgi:hypothetical protein
MYLNDPNHLQIQDVSCSEVGEHLMDFIDERLVEPLILNNLMNNEQVDELSVLGGAIKILAEKAQAYDNLFDKNGQLPYSCN